jgi:hypothetical protein
MELEFQQLDLRYERLRARQPARGRGRLRDVPINRRGRVIIDCRPAGLAGPVRLDATGQDQPTARTE